MIKRLFKNTIELFSNASPSSDKNTATNDARRLALSKIVATGGAVALGVSATAVNAHKPEDSAEEKEERFPGDPPEHFIVYQFNEAEHEYHQHVLGSAGAMVGKYADNIDIVIACFGLGIHILAKEPGRPVHDSIKEKVLSLAKQGVKFHACNRTLSSLQWTAEDVLPFAKIVEVGVADIMELQEQNYAYVAW